MTHKLYSYLGQPTNPLGMGDDDDGDVADFNLAKGIIDWCPDSDGICRDGGPRPEGVLPGRNSLPHGTMFSRAVANVNALNIHDILCHSLPPHPDSDLGQFMATRCYAGITPFGVRRKAYWNDCSPWMLCQGERQLWACDGTYEQAIQAAMANNRIVAATSIRSIAYALKVQNIQQDLSSPIDHPILQYVDELYPDVFPTGRSADIWNDKILDLLEYAYTSLFGQGRVLEGLWLTLGGPVIWGETDGYYDDHFYRIRTPAAAQALGRTKDISMYSEGKVLGDVVTNRLCDLAVALVHRLKHLTSNFYFHTRFVPKSNARPKYQAAGVNGLAEQLVARVSEIPGITLHMINSHAGTENEQNHALACRLQSEYPGVEFIGGVDWVPNLVKNGTRLLNDGYRSIEVGCMGREDWAALPDAVAAVREATGVV